MITNFEELLICKQKENKSRLPFQIGVDLYTNRKPVHYKNLKIFYTGYFFNFDELNKKRFAKVEDFLGDFYLNKSTDQLIASLEGYYSVVIIENEKITILIDKYGVESGYYLKPKHSSGFIFSTSLKLLHTAHSLSLSRNSIANYLLFEDLPEGETLFDEIYKIKRGECVVFDVHSLEIKTIQTNRYFDANNQNGTKADNDIIIEMETLLVKQFKELHSNMPDIEVWNQLSGGVDSSLLQVLLSKIGYNKSYCANLSGYGMDGQYSVEVANHLKCEHRVFEYSIDEIKADMEKGIHSLFSPCIYVGESMFYRSFKELSGTEPSLCISGNGADALFGHGQVLKVLKLYQMFPALFGNLFRLASNRMKKFDFIRFIYPEIRKEQFVLAAFSNTLAKDLFTDEQLVREAVAKKADEVFRTDGSMMECVYASQVYFGEVSRQNPVIYKLAKMNNVMLRFPYIQEDFVSFLMRIPVGQKLKRFENKYYAKKYLEKYLPKTLIYRKKQGKQMQWEYLFTEQSKVSVTKFVKTELNGILKEDVIEHCYGKSGYEGLSLKLLNLYKLHQTLRV